MPEEKACFDFVVNYINKYDEKRFTFVKAASDADARTQFLKEYPSCSVQDIHPKGYGAITKWTP